MRGLAPVRAGSASLGLASALLAACCTGSSSSGDQPKRAPTSSAVASAPSHPPSPSPPAPAPPMREDGAAFPDKVIALTWDDGPDRTTLELASYLKKRRISATFFVVKEWAYGLSDDPGEGKNVFESGYERLPVLGDLVELGHRIGNHTLHHVILREARGRAVVEQELRDNQRNLDPFLTNELRLFRAPGGGFGAFAEAIVLGDPYLARMVGPVAWDIDRKDWDESLQCRGPGASSECERGGPGGLLRTKPSVVAARYVATAESAGHGIVLLHDRVGHVGSRYSLDVAEVLIPQLEARGFVFAAPVLRFSPLVLRHRELGLSEAHRLDSSTLRLGDVNGDQRDDLCGRSGAGVTCAISVQKESAEDDRLPRTVFRIARPHEAHEASPSGALHLADVTGDGQADVCISALEGVSCAASNAAGELRPFRIWSHGAPPASLHFADIDGDGKADACGRTATGITCARSRGGTFEAARPWRIDGLDALAGPGRGDAPSTSDVYLADVDGDGRADACGRGSTGVVCALSTGKGFAKMERWSTSFDFTEGTLRFGDLNGDGRDDVCGSTFEGVVCALSTARGFTRATVWLGREALRAARADVDDATALGDINGDGRADWCARAAEGVMCALAP